MSNMSPQKPNLTEVWKDLSRWLEHGGKDLKFCFNCRVLNIGGYGTIGRNKVKIPSKYYKVIYAPEKNIMIGFLMSNAKLSGQLSSYAISVTE